MNKPLLNKILIASLLLNFFFVAAVGVRYYRRSQALAAAVKQSQVKPLALDMVMHKLRVESFKARPNQQYKIIFLGDSLTDLGEWNELLPGQAITNRGISSDLVEGVQARLPEIIRRRPKKIFLLIGINNLTAGDNADEVASKIDALIRDIEKSLPDTFIHLQSLLPTTGTFADLNPRIITVNKKLASMNSKQTSFLDIHSRFMGEDGRLKADLSADGLHLNSKGYELWASILKEYVIL